MQVVVNATEREVASVDIPLRGTREYSEERKETVCVRKTQCSAAVNSLLKQYLFIMSVMGAKTEQGFSTHGLEQQPSCQKV